MTRLEEKKDRECFFLSEFLRLLSKEMRVVEDDRERPDFVISDVSGRLIGVEETEYHNNEKIYGSHTRREIEEAWEKLREKINSMVFFDHCMQNLCGVLIFGKIMVPSKKERSLFLEDLKRCANENKNNLPVRVVDFHDYPLLKSYLHSLWLRNVDCQISWDSNICSGWMGIDRNSLLKLINQKVKDLEEYSLGQGFDENWLLIVSDGAISKSMGVKLEFNLNTIPELSDILKRSKFKKVFVFQYMYDDIYEWTEESGWVKC